MPIRAVISDFGGVLTSPLLGAFARFQADTGTTIAFLPDTQKFVVMRVPYPMGFYPRGLDARIDDPAAGWKGKAIWSDNSETALWHQETGEGSYGKVVKFQLRPDPLAD